MTRPFNVQPIRSRSTGADQDSIAARPRGMMSRMAMGGRGMGRRMRQRKDQ